MKIHVVESLNLTSEQKARLEKLGKVKWFEGSPSADELIKRAEGADVLAIDWTPIDAAVPKMTKREMPLLVSLPFTGVGFLPLKEAAEKNIKFANSPGYSTESVAEFGIGLMLALVRKIYLYAKGQPKPEKEIGLCGRTIGILGAGRIGTRVGKIAEALGMKVIFWRRSNKLSDVLKMADVVYCALPLSDETKNILGEKEFGMMKKGSFFVTTSPNLIYNHNALLKALDKNLTGAAMDGEGDSMGNYNSALYKKFGNHPKVLLTPHVAYLTDHAIKRGYDMMIDNIEAWVKGKPINIVN